MCGTASKYRPGSIKDILVKPLRIWKQVWAWIIIIYQPSIYLQRRGLDYLEPDVLWEYESKCGRGSIKDFLVNPLCVAPPSFSAPASIQADLWVLEQASRCPSQYIWHNSDFIWNLSVFRRQLYTCTFEEVLPKTVPEHVCEQNSWNWDRLVASSHRLGGSCFACWDKRGVIIRWWARWPIMFFSGVVVCEWCVVVFYLLYIFLLKGWCWVLVK